MNSPKNIILLKFFNVAIILLILYFSIINTNIIPIEEENLPNDKILHLGAYLILSMSTVLARWEIIDSKKGNNLSKNKEIFQKYSIVIIICLIYGIIIEIIQFIVPSRNFDLLDIITNGIGIFAGILIHFVAQKLLERNRIAF